jgi:hypothetical protein
MNTAHFVLRFAWGILAVAALLSIESAHAAVKERVYNFDEAGAIAGQQPAILAGYNRRGVLDTQESTTDYGDVDPPANVNNSLVPMIGSGNAARIPAYASAADRPGALPGNLGLAFDGIDDSLYPPRPPASATTPYPFDPRNFGGRFEVISQAWVKSTSAAVTTPQYVWRIGAENGSLVITANGKWALRTGDSAPTGEAFEVESSIAVQPNVWTHVGILRGGNSSFLYINGSVAATDTGFWAAEGTDLRLGSDLLAAGGFFQGVVDNFSIGTASDGVFNPAVDLDYFADKSITFSGVAGDVDQDGVVDVDDYNLWSLNVGFNNNLGQGDPGTLLKGDVDQSGIVDFYDFQIINLAALNPPVTPGGGSGVPEPISLSLMLGGLLLISMRRLRRGTSRTSLVAMAIVAVGVTLACTTPTHAVVVVADDFYYDGKTKSLHVGGGFDGFQQYRGGQNGAAGSWVGQWNQIGDGVVTTSDFTPPIDPFNGLPEPLPPVNVALYDGFFGVQSELYRDFALAPSVPATQTLYFGGKFKADLAIGTDGGTAVQFYSPRLFLNRIFGDDRDTDGDGVPLDPQRDRTQDVGLGFENDMLVARLGAGAEVKIPVPAGLPNDGNWHTIVGKFEVNAAGTNERLSVWIDPTGVETGGTTAQVEADVLANLSTLVGTFHSQGTVPIDPDNPELGRSYIDDMAIGTAWQDVTTVDIPRLTLRINKADNSAKLINNTATTFQLNGYSVESKAGSLNGTGWHSLDEQNVGNWQQNLATSTQVVESSFGGSSTIAPNGDLPLGSLFNAGGTEDLTGRFTTLDGLVNLLKVEFVTVAGVAGDYNSDGTVNAADYTVWRDNLNRNIALPNEGGITPGVVNAADYEFWKSRFGATSGAGGGSLQSVPEPSAWLLSMFVIGAVSLTGRVSRTFVSAQG